MTTADGWERAGGWERVERKSRGYTVGGGRTSAVDTLKVYRRRNKKSPHCVRLAFRIGADVAKKAGWSRGDRVDLVFRGRRFGLVKSASGLVLNSPRPENESGKVALFVAFSVGRKQIHSFFPTDEEFYEVKDPVITDGVLVAGVLYDEE